MFLSERYNISLTPSLFWLLDQTNEMDEQPNNNNNYNNNNSNNSNNNNSDKDDEPESIAAETIAVVGSDELESIDEAKEV